VIGRDGNHPKKDAMGRLSTQEIFRQSRELNAYGDDWKRAHQIMFEALKTPNFRGLREGNTIGLYKIVSKTEAEAVFINADPPKQFFRNLKQLMLAMKTSGFTKITGETDDLPTIKAMQHANIYKVSFEHTGKHAIRKQTYKVELNV
jgi:hypothetical protein